MITFRDVEQLSRFLDGDLPQADAARLEQRLAREQELAAAFADLRQARAVLRRTPMRRAPRNFTLTPQMAGLRPPLPRAVPALSWASAVAMLLFVCTLGVNLLGRLPFGAAAPLAAAPDGMGGGLAEEAAPSLRTAEDAAYGTPTPAPLTMMALEPTATPEGIGGAGGYQPPAPGGRILPPSEKTAAPSEPVNPWFIAWPALAAALIASALVIRWASLRAFRRKVKQKEFRKSGHQLHE